MELVISIIGAAVAVVVSIVGASLANRNSIMLQTRKLKEHYHIDYITALNKSLISNMPVDQDYLTARHTLFIVAGCDVISKIYEFEETAKQAESSAKSMQCLTDLMKAIRKDLKVSNENLPNITFMTQNKQDIVSRHCESVATSNPA